MSVMEQLGTYSATRERVERGYVITDEATEDDAVAALLAQAPTSITIGGFAIPRRDDECRVDETEVLGVWEGTAVYATGGSSTKPAGDSFDFDVSGEVIHLTHGLKVGSSHYVKMSAGAQDFKGAIGVISDDEGHRIEGVDIQIPKASFTLGKTLPAATFDATYERALALLVGKVNSDTYRGYAAGELLMTRVSASQPDTDEDVRVSVSYAVSANESSDIDLGNGVTITGGKNGWDYLWVRYAEVLDAGLVVRRPVSGYVSRVYERAAFAVVGFS